MSGSTTHQQHSDRHDVELQSTLTNAKGQLTEAQLGHHDPQTDEGAASGSSETLGSQLATHNDGVLERTPTAQDYPVRPEQAQRTVTTASAAGPVHSVFTTNQKRFIVFMASWAGFFSPVSGQIYFPALVPLAKDLHVSNSLINLTLTSYMIFQGLAPTFVGDFADAAGRRPAYPGKPAQLWRALLVSLTHP